jgi:hypothetical protein
MVREIDDFIIEQFDKAVRFIEEWFFLSQKWVERGVLGLFVALSAVDVFLLVMAKQTVGWEIFADAVLFLGMWMEYKQTKTERTARRAYGYLGRFYWIFLCAFFFVINVVPHPMGNHYIYLYNLLTPLWGGIRILMSYVTILDIEGLRGKAAKLSWEKLKELFGTSWVPQPQRG